LISDWFNEFSATTEVLLMISLSLSIEKSVMNNGDENSGISYA